MKLSVALATYNEEENVARCLESVKKIAEEIVIVDGSSTDRTREIAKEFGAKVTVTNNPPIFHINKQKALEKCNGEWILQLDADEIISEELAEEIVRTINMREEEMDVYQRELPCRHLFLRHQKLLEERDGVIGTQGKEYAAFFLPRLNYFLGRYLRYGGVYPDGVVRLIKKGKAWFPCKSVHEQITVDGRVGWLQSDLIHIADASFKRYLKRNSRYIDLLADELKSNQVPKTPVQLLDYFIWKPIYWFLLTQIRHKGIFDGYQGIIFSFFSALRFPRAYWRYLKK